ncbi:response regulator [Tumebacillus permanentifrigoris]|uniref:LuxR family two component transcriptional regulator n=1 Tax=Tumebacillus permanentifrigoris TaxID=378543 RepID=A0A316DCF6_9BACL|nr:response regulator transcription factor [Tumebacillus permanentifrigoris]PWK15891.1 LuxR family two component transcriptional regulator [Tumebacillus permanentifrigoris]
MNTYHVLIADDHPLAREAIRSLLEGDEAFQIVAQACDGRQAVQLCDELQPDLVLMDINMPHLNGLEATRQIKKNHPHVKLVILSVSDNVADLFTAIQFGAQGYLLKNLEPDDWLTYLHALLDEDAEIPREMAGRMLHRFQRGVDHPDEVSPDVLTPREREILGQVAEGATNKQIAERLVIAENTVKNHMKNVLEKLHLQNRVQLAAYAVRHGLKAE